MVQKQSLMLSLINDNIASLETQHVNHILFSCIVRKSYNVLEVG